MEYISAIITITVPLLMLFIPGLFFANTKNVENILVHGSKIFLWSIGVLIAITSIAALMGISGKLALLVVCIAAAVISLRYNILPCNIVQTWKVVTIITCVVVMYGIIAVPYVLLHSGLPTGDSQKSIFWAQEIIEHVDLPSYDIALQHLNRDANDFYTPGLHALTAFVMNTSPYPIMAVGFFSLVISSATCWIGATLAYHLFHKQSLYIIPVITAVLVVTNIRFIRYIREPGYHYQNLVGEFLLFGLFVMLLSLIQKWRRDDAVLALLVAVSLGITHQFSSFIACFVLIPMVVALVYANFKKIKKWCVYHLHLTATILVACVIAGIVLISTTGIHFKLAHFFTISPHLEELLPPIFDYPAVLGPLWFLAGIAGVAVTIANKHVLRNVYAKAFLASTCIFLILSQGPRLFIDIPPVRALLYSVVPLSVFASYFIVSAYSSIMSVCKGKTRAITAILVVLSIVIPITSSAYKAFATTSHEVRTNSTLLPEYDGLIRKLASYQSEGAVLTDDYNRRSSSWIIMSGKPMFTRIASDLERQMNEAKQSEHRRQLYLNQLDYEKIFALGSRHEAIALMKKHMISWITGIENSSNTSFMHNDLLSEEMRGGDIVLYKVHNTSAPHNEDDWLIRSSTLANDIGDREDTFEHLQASIRSSRLSDPITANGITYRSTTAEYVPLVFNVGSYVRVLWDQEKTQRPDTGVMLRVNFVERPYGIKVLTSSTATYGLNEHGEVTIRPEDVPFDDKGFIQLTLYNPDEKNVSIDLIALGLSKVP